MAPSFENLDPETEYDEGEDEIDFSGMRRPREGGEDVHKTDNLQTSASSMRCAWRKAWTLLS